jgi:hypothetical protein
VGQSFSLYKFVRPFCDRRVDRCAGGKVTAVSAYESARPSIPTRAEIEHFDVLLAAVAIRLARACDDERTGTNGAAPGEALQRLRATVLECVAALEQLQATQRYVRGESEEAGAQADMR